MGVVTVMDASMHPCWPMALFLHNDITLEDLLMEIQREAVAGGEKGWGEEEKQNRSRQLYFQFKVNQNTQKKHNLYIQQLLVYLGCCDYSQTEGAFTAIHQSGDKLATSG